MMLPRKSKIKSAKASLTPRGWMSEKHTPPVLAVWNTLTVPHVWSKYVLSVCISWKIVESESIRTETTLEERGEGPCYVLTYEPHIPTLVVFDPSG